MIRFALLRHVGFPSPSAVHFDLLMQTRFAENPDDRVLLSFALSVQDFMPIPGKALDFCWARAGDLSRNPVLLRLQPPHRQAYLDYEGLVGGNAEHVGGRGTVKKEDGGILKWTSPRELDPAKPPNEFLVQLQGVLLCAEFIFSKELSLHQPHWRMLPAGYSAHDISGGNFSGKHTD